MLRYSGDFQGIKDKYNKKLAKKGDAAGRAVKWLNKANKGIALTFAKLKVAIGRKTGGGKRAEAKAAKAATNTMTEIKIELNELETKLNNPNLSPKEKAILVKAHAELKGKAEVVFKVLNRLVKQDPAQAKKVKDAAMARLGTKESEPTPEDKVTPTVRGIHGPSLDELSGRIFKAGKVQKKAAAEAVAEAVAEDEAYEKQVEAGMEKAEKQERKAARRGSIEEVLVVKDKAEVKAEAKARYKKAKKRLHEGKKKLDKYRGKLDDINTKFKKEKDYGEKEFLRARKNDILKEGNIVYDSVARLTREVRKIAKYEEHEDDKMVNDYIDLLNEFDDEIEQGKTKRWSDKEAKKEAKTKFE